MIVTLMKGWVKITSKRSGTLAISSNQCPRCFTNSRRTIKQTCKMPPHGCLNNWKHCQIPCRKWRFTRRTLICSSTFHIWKSISKGAAKTCRIHIKKLSRLANRKIMNLTISSSVRMAIRKYKTQISRTNLLMNKSNVWTTSRCSALCAWLSATFCQWRLFADTLPLIRRRLLIRARKLSAAMQRMAQISRL